MKDNSDDAFHTAQQETYNPNQDCDTGGSINETTEDTSSSSSSSHRDRDNDLYMSAVRDMIADELLASSR
nr:putative nuclease HARBI1 [Tanacetum cinerariifolium]